MAKVISDEIRAEVVFDASSGTPVVSSSKNISSITDSGVGQYVLNFSNALPSINYTAVGSAEAAGGGTTSVIYYERGDVARTTTTLPFRTSTGSNNANDSSRINVIVTGG